MGSILDIINVPIGYLMKWCYQLTSNYGLAIILLAVITRILLLPLGIKQQKGQLMQMKFRPRVQKIQEKYADDRERMQREMSKLQAEGYSPTAGCGTLIIQLPILIGIYNVIRYPLRYVMGIGQDVIDKLLERLVTNPAFADLTTSSTDYQIKLVSQIAADPSAYQDILNGTSFFNLNLNFLGINLAEVPEKIEYFLSSIVPIPTFQTLLWLIPVVSAITAAISTILTQKIGPARYMQDPTAQGKGTMLIMNILGPYMSYAIAFAVPAGLGIYWICSNILMAVQTLALNKIWNPAKFKAKLEAEAEERRQRRKKKKVVMDIPAEETIVSEIPPDAVSSEASDVSGDNDADSADKE